MDGLAADSLGAASPASGALDVRHDRCVELAGQAHARAVAVEPTLTATMARVTGDLPREAFGRLHDLGHCLKELPSLIRKVEDDCLELGCDPDTAVLRVHDALRYTVVMEEEAFTEGVRAFRQGLENAGMMVEQSANMFVAGNRYMGVHDQVRCGDLVVEVQFHTPASIEAKAWSRSRFEVVRDPRASMDERCRAYDECVEHSAATVAIPAGAETLGAPKLTKRPVPRL